MRKTGEEKRRRRRRRRHLKKKARRVILLTILTITIAAALGVKLYQNANYIAPYGTVEGDDEKEIETLKSDAEHLTYTVLDVGDGEAILINYEDKEILIDTGSGDEILKAVDGKIEGYLDYLILTGASDERCGGAAAVFEKYRVGTFITGEMREKTKDMKTLSYKASEYKTGEDMSIDIGEDVTLFIMKPEVSSDDYRDRSLITYLSYKDTGFLALSDAGQEEIARALGSIASCDVIVLSRHGADDVNLFNDAKGAAYFLASCTEDSGFPGENLKEILAGSMYATYKTGDLIFTSYGDQAEPSFDSIEEAI